MKRIVLLAILLTANISVAMDYAITYKISESTGHVLYQDLDRRGLLKDYTFEFIQKIEHKVKENLSQALSYTTSFCDHNGKMNCRQFLQWCISKERREFIRRLKSDKNYFMSEVSSLAFTYPVFLSDQEFVFFVNTAFERKERGEFAPIELYYANMIYPESSRNDKSCSLDIFNLHITDYFYIREGGIITSEVIKKLMYIQEIPEQY